MGADLLHESPGSLPAVALGFDTIEDDAIVTAVCVDEADESLEEKHNYFHCNSCGAKVATDPDQRSYHCAFCDSNYVVEVSPDCASRKRPEFIIGFAVTLDQARETFRRWIAEHKWFQPRKLSADAVIDKLQGVYLPFWSFSMLARSEWSAQIGETWYSKDPILFSILTQQERRTYEKTEWFPLAGNHQQFYSGHLISGSKGLPESEAKHIAPFDLSELQRYQPRYLAGWPAEEYSVSPDEALVSCCEEFRGREHANVRHFMPGDRVTNLQVATRFEHINSDLCLLPVYVLSYRYEDRLYRFLVNGQTGRFAGEKPVSWGRIGMAIGIGVAVIGLIAGLVGSIVVVGSL